MVFGDYWHFNEIWVLKLGTALCSSPIRLVCACITGFSSSCTQVKLNSQKKKRCRCLFTVCVLCCVCVCVPLWIEWHVWGGADMVPCPHLISLCSVCLFFGIESVKFCYCCHIGSFWSYNDSLLWVSAVHNSEDAFDHEKDLSVTGLLGWLSELHLCGHFIMELACSLELGMQWSFMGLFLDT